MVGKAVNIDAERKELTWNDFVTAAEKIGISVHKANKRSKPLDFNKPYKIGNVTIENGRTQIVVIDNCRPIAYVYLDTILTEYNAVKLVKLGPDDLIMINSNKTLLDPDTTIHPHFVLMVNHKEIRLKPKK